MRCKKRLYVPFSIAGCRSGNGEKLSCSQAEPGQAINSAVAYFSSVSCATSCNRKRYYVLPENIRESNSEISDKSKLAL